MRKQGLLSLTGILLLVLLALLTLHEWERVVPDNRPAPPDQPPPMLQLSGVEGRSFSSTGETEFRLEASHMTWIESEGVSQVTQPKLWLPVAQGEWQIRAEHGTMQEQDGHIELTGNVVARRHTTVPLRLETQVLHYMARSERVAVPGEVLILSDQGRIAAGAMDADLRTEVLELRNGVETRYVPPR